MCLKWGVLITVYHESEQALVVQRSLCSFSFTVTTVNVRGCTSLNAVRCDYKRNSYLTIRCICSFAVACLGSLVCNEEERLRKENVVACSNIAIFPKSCGEVEENHVTSVRINVTSRPKFKLHTYKI
jgi:hypothetical protein